MNSKNESPQNKIKTPQEWTTFIVQILIVGFILWVSDQLGILTYLVQAAFLVMLYMGVDLLVTRVDALEEKEPPAQDNP